MWQTLTGESNRQWMLGSRLDLALFLAALRGLAGSLDLGENRLIFGLLTGSLEHRVG